MWPRRRWRWQEGGHIFERGHLIFVCGQWLLVEGHGYLFIYFFVETEIRILDSPSQGH